MKFENWYKETIQKQRRLHIDNKLIEVEFEYTNEIVILLAITLLLAIALGFSLADSIYS